MRSAPRAARATVGFSKPTSRYAFGFVPGAVPQMALAITSFGKLVSHNALGTVPMRSVPRTARATAGFSKPASRRKPSSTLG